MKHSFVRDSFETEKKKKKKIPFPRLRHQRDGW